MKNITNIPYSPPFMPVEHETSGVWTILVGLGYDPVKIIKYEPQKILIFQSNGSEKIIDLSWAFKP
jgi:hypothetical protein